MIIDAEFRSLIPSLHEEKLRDLEASIVAEGCRDALVVWGDILLDGHNRYDICVRHGVEYRTVNVELADRSAAKLWIMRNQLARRNLTRAQRVSLVLRLKDEIAAEAKKRQATSTGGADPQLKQNSAEAAKGETRDELALLAGVSHDTVDKVETVLSEGDQKTKDAMLSGEVSVNAAYKTTNKGKRKKKRKEQGKDEEPTALPKPSIAPETGGVYLLGEHVLYCGDSGDKAFIASCQKRSIRFAFADPPYNATKETWDGDFKWRHDYLSEVAPIVAVTPGIGAIQSFMRETKMPYKWAMSFYINNGMTRGAVGFGNWIFVALFATAKLHRNSQDHFEVSISGTDRDPLKHKGRKPMGIPRQLLELFTKKGDAVLDPFLGTGTTLIAAEEMGRACIGAEIDPRFCASIVARWEQKTGKRAVVRE